MLLPVAVRDDDGGLMAGLAVGGFVPASVGHIWILVDHVFQCQDLWQLDPDGSSWNQEEKVIIISL